MYYRYYMFRILGGFEMTEHTILSKIMNHQINHQHNAMTVCPMVINKKELTELLDDLFIATTLSGEKRHELLTMEHGYIGSVSGVPLYLWDGDNDNQ